jgi:hypothetical protein
MVAELRKDLIVDRSKSKVENMAPAWEVETPLEETSGCEVFFDHARSQVERLRRSYQLVGRKAQGVADGFQCNLHEILFVHSRFTRGYTTFKTTKSYRWTRSVG